MTKKNLKLNIKNKQLASALDLSGVKKKLAAKKEDTEETEKKAPVAKARSAPKKAAKKDEKTTSETEPVVEPVPKPKLKARSKSVFAKEEQEETEAEETVEAPPEPVQEKPVEEPLVKDDLTASEPKKAPVPEPEEPPKAKSTRSDKIKLGPTGKHISDLLPTQKPVAKEAPKPKKEEASTQFTPPSTEKKDDNKKTKYKDFRDVKPKGRFASPRAFDTRDKQGLRSNDDDGYRHRRRRSKGSKKATEDTTVRPTSLSVRIPISIKDLASEMKLKASELISKLFTQGQIKTINDLLDDETTVQLLGHEFGCEITIDTSEEERIRITDQSIEEEIAGTDENDLALRAPVVAFMGHVDHGKTSLIDKIRETNVVAGEAGAITQHIGAFRCHTDVGDITVLDTPGHEAFSEMRARGASSTDIVVLVVAGDEGIREQTQEAIQHAKAAGVTIIVAINKSDKPGFDANNVYRQLADNDLLPESWGGQIVTVNCSAKTGEGIPELLEMLALQAEVLELKANDKSRARGTVLESEMHKGLGAVTTLLIQNGTLHIGDSLVFTQHWGRVKTMRNERGQDLKEAAPSTPVEITGLSGLPEAGEEFIVVSSDREAREIAEARAHDLKEKKQLARKPASLEAFFAEAVDGSGKKILNLVLRADVQGSLEALKVALEKIESDKVTLNIIFTGVGEVSESDIQLAAASKATIIGFHTAVESNAETLSKDLGVTIQNYDVIYHAIDGVKEIMTGRLDMLAEEIDKGKAEVLATFKSSKQGMIAGCQISEGSIHRKYKVRIIRDGEEVWNGSISSIRREKEDVNEVQKGVECGIVLDGFNEIQEGDRIESYEVIYTKQKL